MIFSETIEIIYSNLIDNQVLSEEEPDYRTLDQQLRLTETREPRELENENKRLLE